jgi:hypothetical protein
MSENDSTILSLLVEQLRRLQNENSELRQKLTELSSHTETIVPLSAIQTPLSNLRLESLSATPSQKKLDRCVDSILAYAKVTNFT